MVKENRKVELARRLQKDNSKNGKRYTIIPDKTREELIRRIVKDNKTVIAVADEMNLDYENAKLIHRLFKSEGRCRKTPCWIKHYAQLLKKNDLEQLREKVPNRVEFEQIVRAWQSQWGYHPSNDGLPIWPASVPSLLDPEKVNLPPNAKWRLADPHPSFCENIKTTPDPGTFNTKFSTAFQLGEGTAHMSGSTLEKKKFSALVTSHDE